MLHPSRSWSLGVLAILALVLPSAAPLIAQETSGRSAQRTRIDIQSGDDQMQISADQIQLKPAPVSSTDSNTTAAVVEVVLLGAAKLSFADDDVVVSADKLTLHVSTDLGIRNLQATGDCRWTDSAFQVSCKQLHYIPGAQPLTFTGDVKAVSRDKDWKVAAESLTVDNGKLITEGRTQIQP